MKLNNKGHRAMSNMLRVVLYSWSEPLYKNGVCSYFTLECHKAPGFKNIKEMKNNISSENVMFNFYCIPLTCSLLINMQCTILCATEIKGSEYF